jgi:pimeloyl-ACP methyl ester carboxylesterase
MTDAGIETPSLDGWWAAGAREPVTCLDGHVAELFVVERGEGPVITALHGYPGSGHDFAGLIDRLSRHHRVIVPDLLGFGASAKPLEHAYSIAEQASLVHQLWERRGVTSSILVAHDYSSSLAQELLAAGGEVTFPAAIVMNGGVYPDLHRPTAGQQLLLSADGDEVAAAMTEDLFSAGVALTFGSRRPATPVQLAELWRAMTADGGQQVMSRMLHYVADRRENLDRWTGALETTAVPLCFIWGPEDPVSGVHMLERIRERCAQATVVELDGIGHWPLLEDPEAVAEAAEAFLDLLGV